MCFFSLFSVSQVHYPAKVGLVLNEAGKNRAELVKALNYFYKKGDSLKIKAVNFLISNMDIHSSSSYYWIDTTGTRIPFNELDYATFHASVQAFELLKKKHPGLHPLPFTYRDIDSIKSSYLIDNIERAFNVWHSPWGKNVSFQTFCEYILPYRASVEPLENWRSVYQQQFSWINDSAKNKTTEDALLYLGNDFKKWFANTYGIETRKEPLPRLGALQLLHRKKGPCEDIADWSVFALRSQGFPATNDMVTYWATSSGSHFFNSTLNSKLQPIRFDVSTSSVRLTTFAREPAKVIRTTYSKQPNLVASIEPLANIPDGFMRTFNYKDVTAEYWETKNVTCPLYKSSIQTAVAYACVFNYGDWRPTWWGRNISQSVTFTSMSKGAVYLPAYYFNHKLLPAGYPIAVGYNQEMILKPDTLHSHTITLQEQQGYLVFQPQKKYRLYYWNNAWVLLAVKVAAPNTRAMSFEHVPANALLLLLPEYSQRKERPFVITDEGQRLWW